MKYFKIIFSDKYYFSILATLPFYLIIILLLKFSNLFTTIRFYQIRSNRIGHFSIMPELFLTRKKTKKNLNQLDIFCFDEEICNKFLKKAWSRNFLILPRMIIFPIIFWLKKFKMKKNLIPREEFFAKDIENLLDFSEPNIKFTTNEKELGAKLLEELGIKKNEKYVCFSVRDDEYLKKTSSGDYQYHSYRNTNVKNFKLVAEYLNSKNIKVVRVGSIAQDKLNFKNDKIIDYPFSHQRSDFMDIYIIANCYFYIGGGPGIDSIPILFRKPKLQTNLVPILGTTCELKKVMTIFKHHYCEKLKRNLSIKEIISENMDNVHHTDKFKDKKIKLIENSPKEILDATSDLLELVEDEDNFVKKINQLDQKTFWSIFPLKKKNKENIPLHGQVRGMISPSFLKNNNYLLN